MLDLDHPMTTHVFAASGLVDYLIRHTKYMTLVSTEERQRILPSCQEALERLRQLNAKHFGASAFTSDAIEELRGALHELAGLVTNPVAGNAYAIKLCPACETPLTRVHLAYMPKPEQRWTVYCSPCLNVLMPAREKLDSVLGFGICFI